MTKEEKLQKLELLKKLKHQRDLREQHKELINSSSLPRDKSAATKIANAVAAFGTGVGDSMVRYSREMGNYVGRKLSDVVGLKENPAQAVANKLRQENPTTTALGKMAPELARAVAGYAATSGALPTLVKAGKAAKYLKPVENIVRSGIANVAGGQAASPGIKRIPMDAALGAGFGAIGEVGSALSGPAKNAAAKLYSTVLKRPVKRMAAEASRGGKTLEQFLADKAMFTPTLGRISTVAGKKIDVLSKKINELIKPIKLRVNPGKMIDELQGLKQELNLVDDVGRVLPGETSNVKIIDDMIDHIDTNFLRDAAGRRVSHLSVKEAQNLKQSLWKRAKKVFEQTEASATKREGQAAAGRGIKKGIEEAAEGTGTGWGKQLASMNKEEGMWLEAVKAADIASNRVGKTFLGRMIMPLMFGGAATGAGYAGSKKTAIPLGLAAVMSTPGGRLAAGNVLAILAKAGTHPELVRALAPIISGMRNNDKNGGGQ